MQKMKYDRNGKAENKRRSKQLRSNPNGAEYHLYLLIRNMGQRKILKRWPIGRIIPQLGLPFRNLLLLIEREASTLSEEKRNKRANWLLSRGFNVLRVPEKQIFENQQSILSQIANYLESEENKRMFFVSRRAANKYSYWINDQEQKGMES